MRWILCGLAVIGFTQSAAAGDFDLPFLRGSNVYQPVAPSYPRWGGFYIGGQAGYTSTSASFDTVAGMLVDALIPRNLTLDPAPNVIFQKDEQNTTSYGAFAGYNAQWQDVVIGAEATYTRASLDNVGAYALLTQDQNDNPVTVTANTLVHLNDYGTARARVGYAFGSFLPYVMAGLAIGRADVSNTATVTIGGVPATLSTSKDDTIGYGYTLGAGIDIALMPNIFVRGEFEHVRFTSFSQNDVILNTARAGLGIRF